MKLRDQFGYEYEWYMPVLAAGYIILIILLPFTGLAAGYMALKYIHLDNVHLQVAIQAGITCVVTALGIGFRAWLMDDTRYV